MSSRPQNRTSTSGNEAATTQKPGRPRMRAAKRKHDAGLTSNGARPRSTTTKSPHDGTARTVKKRRGRPQCKTHHRSHEAIELLRVLVRRDQYAIRDRIRIQLSLLHFVNRFLSPPGLPEGEFEKALNKTDKIIATYRTTGDPGPIPDCILMDIADSIRCLQVIEKRQKQITKEIERAAKELPIYVWWETIAGAGAKGLGLIVGHAGNIGTFNKAAGLWQRMGLRNVKFKACSVHAREDTLTKDEWVAIGYSKKRRSVMFNVVDSLLKCQRKVGDKELPAPDRWIANGAYGELAIQRYTEALKHEDWKPLHRQLDVNRVVGKRLLADLLKQWKAG